MFVFVVGWVLWHINLCRLFNARSFFMQIVLFQTIQFCISTQLDCKKTFLFQVIQFIQTCLIQLIQLSIITDFVNTLLNVKNSSILNNSV